MAYETPDGQEIKVISIEVSRLTEIFNDYSKDFPYELLSVLDFLEYDIVNNSRVLELEGWVGIMFCRGSPNIKMLIW